MTNVTHLVIQFIIAGSAVVGVSLAAEKLQSNFLAALLLMFPAITIVSTYFVATSLGNSVAADVLLNALYLLPIWIIYVIALYYFLNKMDTVPALALGILVFFVGAGISLLIKERIVSG